MHYVYILKCSDNSYYVGSTGNLADRIKDHNSSKGADFTSRRLPCFLVWYKIFDNKQNAIKEENRIKKISRVKKEKLIFTSGSIWKHFKGNKYIIINAIGDLICYAELEKWNYFNKNKSEKGNELQVWLRDKIQWLDTKGNGLRFNLIIQ